LDLSMDTEEEEAEGEEEFEGGHGGCRGWWNRVDAKMNWI
jgi:hypothetical protein